MHWNDLVKQVSVLEKGGDGNPFIENVCYDSRKVTPGSVFVAVKGHKVNGMDFIDKALSLGAVAIVSEENVSTVSVPWVRVKNAREAIGVLGKTLWQFDSSRVNCLGITGTNGKTTVATVLYQLFSTAKQKCTTWLFGTVAYKLGEQEETAVRTTPESVDIYRMYGSAAIKPETVIMEVSSHALDLSRIAGIQFNVAVWTNLTQDHLDYHKSMNEYYAAKKKLFTNYLYCGGTAIINTDDEWGRQLFHELGEKYSRKYSYGKNDRADFRIVSWDAEWKGAQLGIEYHGKRMQFSTSLTGSFNSYNLTAAVAASLLSGIDHKTISAVLSEMDPVPGRMERVKVDTDYTVVVDYAHTPDALRKALATARALTNGRLYCVFGCGGDRDRTKRALMAEAVAYGCDEAIVTSDNPRTEDPQRIIDDIVEAMPLDFPYTVQSDRRKAIEWAIKGARSGDCVLIAGKGHEDYQEINGTRHPFDDKEIVKSVCALVPEVQ